MPYLLIHAKVKDFDAWKPVYDKGAAMRRDYGSKGGWLFRGLKERNDVISVFEWESLEKAVKFTQSDDLKKIQEQAGVVGRPEVMFLEQVEKLKA